MFSTIISCLDAYSRSISAIRDLLRGIDFGYLDSKEERNKFQPWMIINTFTSLIVLLIARYGGKGVKDFVFAGMTGSFSPPIYLNGWLTILLIVN